MKNLKSISQPGINEGKRGDFQAIIVSLQKELARTQHELASVRNEFNTFIYAVSHDLKAPLRAAEGFSRAVIEDYSSKLDSRGADYLERIATSMHSMTEMLEQLVHVSRLSSSSLMPVELDLSSLANEIVDRLKRAEPGRKIEFSIEENLKVVGDRYQMRILLERLLSNALKYTAQKEQAKVELKSYNSTAEEIIFAVCDNGVGFEPAQKEKLFKPFQKLHSLKEFPGGTGMGLVVAQKIVERHQGRIWAEGKPDEGACFAVALPRQTNLSHEQANISEGPAGADH